MAMFDVGQVYGNALQIGQGIQQAKRQNSLADLYKTQGEGIAEGDPAALNALAQIDPMAAYDIRRQNAADTRATESHQLGMQYDQARLDELKLQGARAAETHAANMSEIERKNEAESIGRALTSAALAYRQGPEAFSGYVQQNAQALQESGIDPASVTYENFLPLAAGLRGAQEALVGGMEIADAAATPRTGAMTSSMQTLQQRAAAAGLQPGTPEYQQFMLQGGKNDGLAIEATPDGGVRVVQGAAAGNVKFTEGQSKDNVYSTRARGALEAFEPVANALVNRGERIAGAVPFGLGREVQSDEFQVAEQAGTEFLQAVLRKDTGAAITEQEQRMYGETYLPQPGDGPAVLEAKRQARVRAINAIESGMSPAQILAQGKALLRSEQEAMGGQQADPNNPYLGMSDADFTAIDINTLTPEQIDQLMEARSQ